MRSLALTELGRLDVSAASGLVAIEERLHVVADDEQMLCIYDRALRPLERLVLFPGELPEEHAARKAAKPDLEVLAKVGDTLLALGSGSTPARRRGAAICRGQVTLLDLGPLYQSLALPELNLEGAAVAGEHLVLFQRGNGREGINALISLDLAGVERAIDLAGGSLGPELVRSIVPIELGTLEGTALGFTDASPLGDGRLVFTAAAEAGGSTYEDGASKGSIVGLIEDGRVAGWLRVDGRDKLEGLHAELEGDRLELLLVADGDDRAARAPLYRATLSLGDLRR